ncbi:MAG TPA: hypothetical protein VIJ96_01805 [Acidothermaceae bacterium]
MTATLPDKEAKVVRASGSDLQAAVKHATDRSGFSLKELSAQARDRDFATLRARLAWVAVGDLQDGAREPVQPRRRS